MTKYVDPTQITWNMHKITLQLYEQIPLYHNITYINQKGQ